MKRKKRTRTGLYLVMTVVLLFCATLGFHSFSLRADCQAMEQQKEELEARKVELEKEHETIQQKKTYMTTNEYVEEMAREKFGLVYDNEIVFKAK